MATSLASPVSSERISGRISDRLRGEEYRRERGFAVGLVTALTFCAVLVHGYHPYAEDGGVYMPEIKRLVDPSLYPRGPEFVMGHLRYSMFAPLMARMVWVSHLSVEMVLLLVHVASFWAMLFAAWMLAKRCFGSREARCGAVALLAAWMTLPIAGTSLMLMDPYVTARSLSTPCALLALVGALDFLLLDRDDARRWQGLALCCFALVGAGVMHPLMGGYALGSVLLLRTVMSPSRTVRWWGTAGLAATALAVAGGLVLEAPVESGIYRQVMLTREYWFLSQWHWYELGGLVAPMLILAGIAVRRKQAGDEARVGLARMALAAGVTATAVALLFARAGMMTHLVARLQPLRIFQLVYVVMTLALGAALGERVLQRRVWRWAAAFSVLGGVMVSAERMTFPDSKHLELPGAVLAGGGGNEWERAFVWIRGNTPKDALFALDAHYITRPGEDAQGFRAIAERSEVPDYSKDGGVVSNKPELAGEWMRGEVVQTGLSTEGDAQRVAGLRPLGVGWVVLEREAATRFACAYENAAVKVCRLP
ncbi:DUF6798 domain-containing protein [Granulicella sp. L60]|uniref:DUF6798 domain-containing protein n=1 Tax=Granulicella sp. L60 TaxID=1641866 RepID=UPI00131D4B01|nr:DUF6798 domain-containing protein [Granulicella sp. L60]